MGTRGSSSASSRLDDCTATLGWFSPSASISSERGGLAAKLASPSFSVCTASSVSGGCCSGCTTGSPVRSLSLTGLDLARFMHRASSNLTQTHFSLACATTPAPCLACTTRKPSEHHAGSATGGRSPAPPPPSPPPAQRSAANAGETRATETPTPPGAGRGGRGGSCGGSIESSRSSIGYRFWSDFSFSLARAFSIFCRVTCRALSSVAALRASAPAAFSRSRHSARSLARCSAARARRCASASTRCCCAASCRALSSARSSASCFFREASSVRFVAGAPLRPSQRATSARDRNFFPDGAK
mmetsp:Transcript_69690/g.157561  ORF Transcript_69690/g.157561 Transcript_69690/m.157561 type:complete len:301 (-) Transcript_69690:209-1111(-)